MKFLHTSDLHIGKRVLGFSMLEDQRHMLDVLYRIIQEEKPDAVLIAGDIYDKNNPSEEAVKLLDDFLVKLSRLELEAFVLSGNHDSPEKIAFASRLIDDSGIHMAPAYNGALSSYTMHDEYGAVNIYMLPFVKPLHVKRFYPEEEISDYTAAVRVALSKVQLDKRQRNVLLAHQFITGSTSCDSEVSVGGLDNVDASCFDDFSYVALGHIHTPQDVRKNRIRYSGSPLKYSMSELKHNKSVTIVEMDADGVNELRTIPITPVRDFKRIEGFFDDIIEEYKAASLQDYIEVVLKDEEDVHEAFRRLQSVFCNLMQLRYDNARTRKNQTLEPVSQQEKLSELDLIKQLFVKQNNHEPDECQLTYLKKVIDEAKEGVE